MQQNFLQTVQERARKAPAKIIFPETFDDRTLRAIEEIKKLGVAQPVLLGDFQHDTARKENYATALFELRKKKGMTLPEAKKLMENFNYFAIMMLKMNEADALISGANSPSSETLRPTLQIIQTKEKFHKVSGFFIMVHEERLLFFADCMVNIEPNSHDLADIAIDTAETVKHFGIDPKIAMLSFSTNGSAKHPSVDRVHEATALIRERRPDLVCEGEMQVDAALVPDISARKFPGSKVPGTANILIFPDLDSANISYKLVERLGHAQAIGPILQGLQKPVNDLSRGCSVDDIVQLAAITSVQTQHV